MIYLHFMEYFCECKMFCWANGNLVFCLFVIIFEKQKGSSLLQVQESLFVY